MTSVILAPNWLGDMVMALPAMTALRDGLGERCVIVARPTVAEIARVVTDEVVVARRSALDTVHLVRRLRAYRPEVVVSLLRSRRAGLIALGSGAPVRVGWDSGPARRAYSVRAPSARKQIHQVEEYLRLPRAMDIPARAVWPDFGLLSDARAQQPCIVLAPGSSFGPAKRWPAHHYAALARALVRMTHLPVALVGSRAEEPCLADIAREAGPGVHNLAGRTTLHELAALVASARLFVGNDSGVAHLAAWSGVPVVVIFGSTSPRWTEPMGPRVRVVYREEPCSPCFRRRCPLGHTNCLTKVAPAEVLASCVHLLAEDVCSTQEEQPNG